MKREIKFRAWIKKASAMASWEMILNECDRFSLLKNPDFIFMQYTGLKDKNGKEIYDKDIVKFHLEEKHIHHSKKDIIQLIGSIEWDSADTGYYIMTQYPIQPYIQIYWTDNIEVIGNIYENPELIKDK